MQAYVDRVLVETRQVKLEGELVLDFEDIEPWCEALSCVATTSDGDGE